MDMIVEIACGRFCVREYAYEESLPSPKSSHGLIFFLELVSIIS